MVAFYSADGSMDFADIADYVAANVQDPVSRTPGVGDYQLFGSQYAMRIWLDPAKLNNFALTPDDVSAAITVQNVQVASGELGGLPSVPGQELNATIVGPSRLQTPEQFRQILLKVNPDGSQVRPARRGAGRAGGGDLLDPGQVQRPSGDGPGDQAGLGRERAGHGETRCTPRSTGSSRSSRAGWRRPTRTTPRRSCRISIGDVVRTLIEAIGLVFLVMYLFLQSFRATIIPTIAIPVVLLGTFAVLSAFGYSINVLTMFAMVLAIGLLVDDAIVVIENVERVMAEEGLSPKRGHPQVDGPDHRRAGRHRAGADGGVPADGFLQRLDRRDLPAVLRHHRLGDDAVGPVGADLHAGALRDDPEAGARRKEAGLFRLVQPVVRPRQPAGTRAACGARSPHRFFLAGGLRGRAGG